MNTIVVTTDFSAHAENAANYAWQLAKCINSRIILCNAFDVPAQEVMAAQVAWPLEDYKSMQEASTSGLKSLAGRLEKQARETDGIAPLVSCENQAGSVADVTSALAIKERAVLVVMGTSKSGGLVRFLWGSNRSNLMEDVQVPLLLVPENYQYKSLKRIAFATDWNESDIEILQTLASLAKYYNAAILIIHITNSKETEWLKNGDASVFLNRVTCRVNYPNIYYRQIRNDDIDKGLNWFSENGNIDMLAMVHRRHPLIERLLIRSHTKTVAKYNQVPLLVFPAEASTNGDKYF
jgi:nucleotide-binding universal stress UspA family protein